MEILGSFIEKYSKINTYMLWIRSVEEISLVRKEMVQYLITLANIRATLIQEIENFTIYDRNSVGKPNGLLVRHNL